MRLLCRVHRRVVDVEVEGTQGSLDLYLPFATDPGVGAAKCEQGPGRITNGGGR